MRIGFGRFIFDSGRRELTRDDSPVPLSPKAFDLLSLLIRHSPKAVRKQELYDQLWPDTYVEFANLHNLISEIRSAVGDERRTTITTRRNFGFAFTAKIERLDSESTPEQLPYICRVFIGGRSVDLAPGRNVIGRDPDCAIVLDTPLASRHHAAICTQLEGVELRDLDSKNGTYLRGERVSTATLRDGDRIEIGRTMLRVRVIERRAATVTDQS